MRNECELTDEEIETLFSDAFAVCLTVDDVIWTRETIEQWKNGPILWRESGTVNEDEIEGYHTLEIRSVQIYKGQTRHNVGVIDFGTTRASATF